MPGQSAGKHNSNKEIAVRREEQRRWESSRNGLIQIEKIAEGLEIKSRVRQAEKIITGLRPSTIESLERAGRFAKFKERILKGVLGGSKTIMGWRD